MFWVLKGLGTHSMLSRGVTVQFKSISVRLGMVPTNPAIANWERKRRRRADEAGAVEGL
jgi:hypothetical protein